METNILLNALKKIQNPIVAMQSELKEGEQLDGIYAVALSENHTYLKEIARKALEEYASQSHPAPVGGDVFRWVKASERVPGKSLDPICIRMNRGFLTTAIFNGKFFTVDNSLDNTKYDDNYFGLIEWLESLPTPPTT